MTSRKLTGKSIELTFYGKIEILIQLPTVAVLMASTARIIMSEGEGGAYIIRLT
jgi:hypothetical protein